MLLCIAAFVAQVVVVYVVIWMPLVLTSIGLDVTRGILTSVAFTGGGIVGTVGLARFIDKNKSYYALVATFMLSAILIASIGFFASNWYWLLAIVFISGLPTIGANIVLYAYSATIYPASIRSTGLGWVVGSGRVGAIAGSLLGTALIALGLTIEGAYVVAAVPAIIGALAIALIRAPNQSARVGRSTLAVSARSSRAKCDRRDFLITAAPLRKLFFSLLSTFRT
jgi:AAHS family 4-hydroxybenzoate transporter-like MFS transporter